MAFAWSHNILVLCNPMNTVNTTTANTTISTDNMSFDLIDDIFTTLDEFDRDMSFGDLIDDISHSDQRGTKREHSQRDIVRCITKHNDDGISDEERDGLNEFLQGIGFLQTLPEKLRSSDFIANPSEKRRRVTPPQPPAADVGMLNLNVAVTSQSTQKKTSNVNKTRTTRQFVPFEEMQRLMATYGPIKTPRKSKSCPDEYGAKSDSIRRKFYRWFPDFEERFQRNSDGLTYNPKAGHDEEIQYREAKRNMDKEILVHKRKVGRKNVKCMHVYMLCKQYLV
jgi:hypothetical protein